MNNSQNSQLSLQQEYKKIQQKIRNKHKNKREPRKLTTENQSISPNQENPQINYYQIENLNKRNQQLQLYIKQLSEYIQDTSAKYSRNVETLKDSYKQMYNSFTNRIVKLEQQLLIAKNSYLMEKEIRMAKQSEIVKINNQIIKIKQQLSNQETKNKNLKQKIDEMWNQTLSQKDIWNQLVDKMQKQNNNTLIKIQDKQEKIKILEFQLSQYTKKISEMQTQKIQNLTLPQKIRQYQLKIIQLQTLTFKQKQQILKLQREIDFLKIANQKSEKQRQNLQLKNSQYQDSFQVLFMKKIKTYQVQWQEKYLSQQQQNINLKQSLQNLQQTFKITLLDKSKLQTQCLLKLKQINKLQKQLDQEKKQKQSYLNQFRSLKKNYQSVINTLEDSIRELQSKNWTLQDEKKDLQVQLQNFQKLVKQLTSINQIAMVGNSSPQLTKQLYNLQNTSSFNVNQILKVREQVQREMFASRKNKNNRFKQQQQRIRQQYVLQKSEDNMDWQKLIGQIKSLSVNK